MRARLPLKSGDLLDEHEIENARLHLLSTGLFESVSAKLSKGARRGRVIVIFECVERPTTSIDAVHLGHARPTKVWAGLEISDLDPFGAGVAMGAGLVASGDQLATRANAALQDLGGLGVDLSLQLSLIEGLEPFVGPVGQRRDGVDVLQVPTDYSRRGLAPAASIWLRDVRLAVGLNFERVTANLPGDVEQIDADGIARPFEFNLREGRAHLFSTQLSAERDTRDDPAFPTRGTRASVLARVGWYGGQRYVRALVGLEWYHRLPNGHVVRLDAKAGAVTGDAPFFERFFIGDVHTYIPDRVLGLNFARRRGPNIIGGAIREQRYERYMGRAGVEYRIPLGKTSSAYRLEWFLATALVGLGDRDALSADTTPMPYDLTIDTGIRLESEYGVMGISVGNLFLLVDPS